MDDKTAEQESASEVEQGQEAAEESVGDHCRDLREEAWTRDLGEDRRNTSLNNGLILYPPSKEGLLRVRGNRSCVARRSVLYPYPVFYRKSLSATDNWRVLRFRARSGLG